MPTNGFSIKLLKVKLLAGEQKEAEFARGWMTSTSAPSLCTSRPSAPPSVLVGDKFRHIHLPKGWLSQRVQVPSKEALRPLFTPKSHPHQVLGMSVHKKHKHGILRTLSGIRFQNCGMLPCPTGNEHRDSTMPKVLQLVPCNWPQFAGFLVVCG